MTCLFDFTQWQLADPITHRNFTQFPLIGGLPVNPPYLTLDQATIRESIKITEVSEGGSVPELYVENTGQQSVLLLDGEQLIGAKQNRILNLTVLIPGKTAIKIPVSCVEQGRWAYDSDDFHASERTIFAAGRARKAASVSEHMETNESRMSDQSEVWAQISEKSLRMNMSSPTSAMEALYENSHDSLEDHLKSIAPQDGQSGAVFAINSQIIGMDLFSYPSTFHKLFRKLVSGYLVDAIEVEDVKSPASINQVRGFLDRISLCEAKEYPAIGLGKDLRYNSDDLTVAGLTHDNQTVHLCAFSLRQNPDEQTTSDITSASSRARFRRCFH